MGYGEIQRAIISGTCCYFSIRLTPRYESWLCLKLILTNKPPFVKALLHFKKKEKKRKDFRFLYNFVSSFNRHQPNAMSQVANENGLFYWSYLRKYQISIGLQISSSKIQFCRPLLKEVMIMIILLLVIMLIIIIIKKKLDTLTRSRVTRLPPHTTTTRGPGGRAGSSWLRFEFLILCYHTTRTNAVSCRYFFSIK